MSKTRKNLRASAPLRENTGLNDLADLLLAEVACPLKPEGEGWVSVAEMAAEKGMNDTTLRVQLNKLEKLGKVERKLFICPNSRKRVGFWRVRE